jgi:L-alanine-DL-glutamate epimerase-like enolase superfamily enzyme
MAARELGEASIRRVEVAAYRIPTEVPESDGTYRWDVTTLVAVHVSAGNERGFGYTYASAAVAPLIREQLASCVLGRDALAVEACWNALGAAVRNVGRPGIAATAISALDAALWDLKAKLLGVSLVRLLGQVRESVPVYGSGGFTSYDTAQLCTQVAAYVEQGIPRVKMKVGTHPAQDVARVAAARAAVRPSTELMVDANGAYTRHEAVAKADAFRAHGVSWFEEPVSSDDLEGLAHVRAHAPPGMAVTAGEYGYDPLYFRRMLEAGAVDVLQADATRCLGITGFLAAARLCQSFGVPLSAHCAPSLHLHPACAATPLVHVEYFHDHVRIEERLLDGFCMPHGGALRPDATRPGNGVGLKLSDARKYLVEVS